MNLPDFVLLGKTGKDKGLPLGLLQSLYEVVQSRQLVLPNEKKSNTDAWIAVVNGCITRI